MFLNRNMVAFICLFTLAVFGVIIQGAVFSGRMYLTFQKYIGCCNAEGECGGNYDGYNFAALCADYEVNIKGSGSSTTCYCSADDSLTKQLKEIGDIILACNSYSMTSSGQCSEIPGIYDSQMYLVTVWLSIGVFCLSIVIITTLNAFVWKVGQYWQRLRRCCSCCACCKCCCSCCCCCCHESKHSDEESNVTKVKEEVQASPINEKNESPVVAAVAVHNEF